jgi:F-type H+-transporting ATPase subunit c
MTLMSAKAIGGGLATIALAGAGVGIGLVFNGFLTAYSRNPELDKTLFGYCMLGFALSESIALFGLMMAFMIIYM